MLQPTYRIKCLFFLDNITDDTPQNVLVDFVNIVKSTYKPKFLVTSRELLDFMTTDGLDMRQVFVGPMNNREARELIQHLLPGEKILDDINKLMRILNFTDCNPGMIKEMVVRERRISQSRYKGRISNDNNSIRDRRSRRGSLTRLCQQPSVCRGRPESKCRRKRSLSMDN